MQTGQQFRRIPIERAAQLPRLTAPAGYVVVIQDVDYGNRFKIARLQQIDRDQLRRVTELSIETQLALILEAENAAALALAVHDRFVGRGSVGTWFDLDVAQIRELDEFGRPQAKSLRDLALNEMGAASLVEDAKIVRTAPQSPFAHLQRREKPPARRWRAWAILLLIIVLLALAVTRGTELRREIARLLNSRQSVTTQTSRSSEPPARVTATATYVSGQGEVFYVRTPARARSCASTACQTNAILEVGFRLVSLRYQRGEPVDNDLIWIAFRHRGVVRFVHRSLLSTRPPIIATTEVPTQRPSPSATPVPTIKAVLDEETVLTDDLTGQGEVYFVRERARARSCASTACQTVTYIDAGSRIVALRYQAGQSLAGNDVWIRFMQNGALLYVHRSVLSTVAPETVAAEETAAVTGSATTEESAEATVFLPTASHTATVAPSITATFTATATPTATYTNTATPTAIPTNTATPTSADTATAVATEVVEEVLYVNTVNDLNARIRACASTNCEIVGRLRPGDEVRPEQRVSGQTVNGSNTWIEFEYKGESAYIHSSLLSS